MKAFVKTTNGTFADVNFYLAWKGFNEMGYSVVLMDDVDKAEITIDTPVFAGTRTFDQIVTKLVPTYKRLETYPEELKPLLNRKLELTTLKEAKKRFAVDEHPMFVKPVIGKQFQGGLWKSFLDLIPLVNKPDDAEVYVAEPVKFESEFRCYINDREIVGVKHYAGRWDLPIQEATIEEAVRMFKHAPVAYSIDLGVVNGYPTPIDTLVEVNDGTSLGNYGLDSLYYAEMLVARWYEIVADHEVKKDIDAELKEMEDYSTPSRIEERRKSYYEKWENHHLSHKDCMVEDKADKLKIDALKDYIADARKEYVGSSY